MDDKLGAERYTSDSDLWDRLIGDLDRAMPAFVESHRTLVDELRKRAWLRDVKVARKPGTEGEYKWVSVREVTKYGKIISIASDDSVTVAYYRPGHSCNGAPAYYTTRSAYGKCSVCGRLFLPNEVFDASDSLYPKCITD